VADARDLDRALGDMGDPDSVTSVWGIVLGFVLALVAIWVVLVVVLYVVARKEEDPATLRDVLRLIPDVVRLIRRLAVDPELPRGVRWRLLVLLVYLLLPIDIIPDFIPVVGYADDAVVVALALRSVVHASGPEALDRHWPGTPQGLTIVRRLAGV
jgi:uncharacterized membrane protein YkvA (DUF1232 family)